MDQEDIYKHLDFIVNTIKRDKRKIDNLGIFTGLGGVLLFEKDIALLMDMGIQNIEETLLICNELILSNKEIIPSYCGGMSGFLWAIEHIEVSTGLELYHKNQINQIENTLFNKLKLSLDKQNFEFMNGSLGYVFYFYSKFMNNDLNSDKYVEYISYFLTYLEKNKEYLLKSSLYMDFGLPHGILSLQILLSHLYKIEAFNHFKKTIIEMINNSIDHLFSFKLNSDIYLLPHTADLNMKSNRLAWCYGDLIACYSLVVISKNIGNLLLETEILHFLNSSVSNRRSQEEALLHQHTLCHGTLGVALIFERLFDLSSDPCFKNAADFWLETYFEKINYANVNKMDLLTGLSGIGLVLTNRIKRQSDWYKCLLLN